MFIYLKHQLTQKNKYLIYANTEAMTIVMQASSITICHCTFSFIAFTIYTVSILLFSSILWNKLPLLFQYTLHNNNIHRNHNKSLHHNFYMVLFHINHMSYLRSSSHFSNIQHHLHTMNTFVHNNYTCHRTYPYIARDAFLLQKYTITISTLLLFNY